MSGVRCWACPSSSEQARRGAPRPEAAGGDRREAMMVQFADEADGELAKVTRSTTIDEIRGAAELCVQPKARR